MKLGIFDSGLGGLLITKAIREHIPDIDILYYGDTLRVPYGNRSEDAIYGYTRDAIDYLFAQNCKLIVMACNTASASALRRLQQTYLASAWPGRNVIGVVVPTLEAAIDRGYERLGLIGTNYLVKSNVYADELQKINPSIQLHQVAAPLLVPLIENDGLQWAPSVLEHYLQPLKAQNVQCLLLGCTHYPVLRDSARQIMGPGVEILGQDEIIPPKLADYLKRHPEYSDHIGRSGRIDFHVSDRTDSYVAAAHAIYGGAIAIDKTAEAA